jgi:hypothetical protein
MFLMSIDVSFVSCSQKLAALIGKPYVPNLNLYTFSTSAPAAAGSKRRPTKTCPLQGAVGASARERTARLRPRVGAAP